VDAVLASALVVRLSRLPLDEVVEDSSSAPAPRPSAPQLRPARPVVVVERPVGFRHVGQTLLLLRGVHVERTHAQAAAGRPIHLPGHLKICISRDQETFFLTIFLRVCFRKDRCRHMQKLAFQTFRDLNKLLKITTIMEARRN